MSISMRNSYKILLDSTSKRHIDENGFLHVSLSHISKETVNPYYGYEIPRYEELGLDPTKIYQGYRSGTALSDGAKTFNGLPILWDHHLEHADSPQKEFRIGSLGTDAQFNAPYLDNSLIFTDSKAVSAILNGEKIELSAGYMFDPVLQSGVFEGQPYDFIMTNIRGNHVALVDEGRAGPDVVVADAQINLGRQIVTKLKRQLKKALAVFDAKDANPDIERTEVDLGKALLAVNELEAAEEGLTNEEIGLDEDKDAKIKDIIQTYFANATPDEIKKITDTLTDLAYSKATGDKAVEDDDDDFAEGVKYGEELERDPEERRKLDREHESEGMRKAMDACGLDADDPAAQKAFAEGVKYGEELIRNPEERRKLDREHESEGMKKAMDAALIVKTAESRAFKKMQDIHKAIQDVRHLAHFHSPHVFDSALSVYKAALRVSGINPMEHPKAAWPSLCKTLKVTPDMPRIATDSKKLSGSFSHLSKVRVEG